MVPMEISVCWIIRVRFFSSRKMLDRRPAGGSLSFYLEDFQRGSAAAVILLLSGQ